MKEDNRRRGSRRQSMDFVEVVDVVSAVLRQLKGEPYGESYFIRRAINKVEASIDDLVRIKNFIVYDHDEVENLLENLLSLVYKMEDFYETQFLRRMHVRRVGFGRIYIFILRQMLNLKAKVVFGGEMRKIEREIDDVIKESDVIRKSHPREQSDVVGLEEEKGKMVRWLTDANSSPKLGFLLISGQIGSGKTTFATEIYKSPELKRHFKFRAWVSAFEDPVSNLRSILQQLDGDSTVYMKSTEAAELKEKICETLQKKRCLLVVDNNMLSPYNLFEILPGSALPDEGNGSRVIMTTIMFRNRYFIDYFMDEYGSRTKHYELKPLQEEDAWHLFLKKVRFPDKSQSNQSSDLDNKLKTKIIKISQCIPSAIVVLGRFLSTKKCYQEWLAVLEKDPIEGNEVSDVSKMLALMNSDLTSRLRRCMLYFGLFPRGCEIPVRRLLRLWLAEGLIVNDDPNPEDNPEWFSLKMKGMIEITKSRKDGGAKTCRMPGILHDMCLSKAEDIFGLLHIHPTTPDPKSSSDHASPSPSPKFGVRRVSESGGIKNYSGKDSRMQHLRSFLSFNTGNKDTPTVEIGKFLSTEVIGHGGLGMLKVLDLERVYKPELPNNLGQLYQLRYLGLRWTFLDTLPHSVSELRYLQTLDVKHTGISSLPNSIWKMQHLRHLCLNETRLDKPVGKHGISLPELQTLWGIFVDKKIPVKHGLDRSTNLTKLGLTSHEDSVEELYDWIINLKELKFLRLRSKNYYGQASKLKLNSLSRLENLSNLYLHGKLPELRHPYFPERLEHLTLSVSNLKEDPMPILAKLPCLSDLRLLADSYIGKKMVCPNDGFESLRSLKLWMLKELETWTVKEGAMQDLEELEIRCCHKLEELPDELDLEYIEKIILTNMDEEFVAHVRDKLPEGKSSILEPQKLQVRCHCQDDVKQV